MQQPLKKAQRRAVFVQSGRCRDTDWLPNGTRIPSLCVICARWREYGSDIPCRFQGFRKLRHTSSGMLEEDGFDEGTATPRSNIYPGIFDNDTQDTDIADLQLVVAQALKPILDEELVVHSQPNLVFKCLEKDLVACDACNTSILFSSWFCTECAQEICGKCLQDGTWQAGCHTSCNHELLACSRIRSAELKAILTSMELLCGRDPPEGSRTETSHIQKCRVEAEKYRITPRLAPKHSDAFRSLWPLGIPLSVDLPPGVNFDPYTPENLNILHGTKEALVSKCDFSPRNSAWRWKSTSMPIRSYLKTFSAPEADSNLVVKIEELPQYESMASAYPLEYAHCLKIIPFPLHTSTTGVFNLLSHYALDQCDRSANKPDLGPKMHLSASTTYLYSMTLRVNMVGTMYILTSRNQARSNAASWTIFRREDTAQLRDFLSEEYPHHESEIINGRSHFLDRDDLRKLRERKILPFTTVQKPGVAILIPPGCVYQSIGNIIQLYTGFVDCLSLGAVMELNDEWRKRRLPDTVQIKWILWHAWHSLLALKEVKQKAAANPDHVDEPPSSSKSRKSQTVNARDNRALKRLRSRIAKGRLTESEYAATHIYHCPHAGCMISRRLFAVPNIFNHLATQHGIDLTAEERESLSQKAPDEWRSEFDALMLRRSPPAECYGNGPEDPIVISP